MSIFLGDSEPSKIFVGDTPISKVFLGDTQVRPSGWQPGANTVAYFPLEADLTDHGPNSISVTNNGVTLVSGQASIDVGRFNGSSDLAGANYFNFGDFHLGCWLKMTSIAESQFVFGGASVGDVFFGYQTFGGNNRLGVGRNGVAWDSVAPITLSANTRYYICYDREGSSLKISLNGTSIGTSTNSNNYITSGGFRVGDDGEGFNINGYMSKMVIENVVRTAQEISNYYNQTKNQYGIS